MHLHTYITGAIQTKAYRILRGHVYEVLNQYDLTPTHWAMLGVIFQSPNGVRQAEIARAINVKPPLITVMAKFLQEKTVIMSAQNQFDTRAKLLAITPEGKKFIKIVEKAMQKRLDVLLEGLTEKDLTAYHKVLVTIIANDTAA